MSTYLGGVLAFSIAFIYRISGKILKSEAIVVPQFWLFSVLYIHTSRGSLVFKEGDLLCCSPLSFPDKKGERVTSDMPYMLVL